MKLKVISFIIIILGVLLCGSASALEQNEIAVIVNSVQAEFDVSPVIINDRTMVPLRAIGEYLNASVYWEAETQKVSMISGGVSNELYVGNTNAVKNTSEGETENIELDSPPVILGERTFVPLRYLAQCLDMEVIWEADTRTVFINDKTTFFEEETIMVEIIMENGGVMELELYPEHAPITVENFVGLVESGFYDGLTFHRIIKGFMVQGGDPLGNGMGGSDKQIKGEFSSNGVNNPIIHERGVISMARSMNPDSASSQFFIMHENAPHLDGQYAAFGRMISGFEVLDELADTPVSGDAPTQKPVIKSITIK